MSAQSTTQAEQSREEARVKASGQFGTQPHNDSGIVTVDPIFTRQGGELPIPLVDQDALAEKFGLGADCDLDTYMAWQEAVRVELAKHLATGMTLESWWEFADDHAQDMDPVSEDLSAAMILKNDIGAPFMVRATSTMSPFVRDDNGNVIYLSAADLCRHSPNWAGDGTTFWPPMTRPASPSPNPTPSTGGPPRPSRPPSPAGTASARPSKDHAHTRTSANTAQAFTPPATTSRC